MKTLAAWGVVLTMGLSCTVGAGASAAPKGGLLICAAGAPASLFGPEDAPRFAEAFDELRKIGFDSFFPEFLVWESGKESRRSAHATYFLELDPASPRYAGGRYSPYAAARGRIKILLPAFTFVPNEQWKGKLDTEKLRSTLTRFKRDCLKGDDSVLAGFETFDEPASQAVVAQYYPTEGMAVRCENLAPFMETCRSVLTKTPRVVVEGALPFVVGEYPDLKDADMPREAIGRTFWEGVDKTAGVGDWYGFDVYPVPKTERLGIVGEYVRQAVRRAPGKKILSVIQGYGEDDFGGTRKGRRPTAAETRFMAFDSVINGARWIIWYGQSAIDTDRDPVLWNAIKTTVRELRRIAPILDLPPAEVRVANPNIEAIARTGKRETTIIAANTSPAAQTFKLVARGPATDFFTGKPAGGADAAGEVTVTLGAYGVGVYKMKR